MTYRVTSLQVPGAQPSRAVVNGLAADHSDDDAYSLPGIALGRAASAARWLAGVLIKHEGQTVTSSVRTIALYTCCYQRSLSVQHRRPLLVGAKFPSLPLHLPSSSPVLSPFLPLPSPPFIVHIMLATLLKLDCKRVERDAALHVKIDSFYCFKKLT